MNQFSKTLAVVTLAAASFASPMVHAQAAGAGDLSEAEVRKVDKDNKKITLKHGAIKNLDMPPMTMVFGVSDEAFLDKVQVGDKVRFKANNDGGKFTVTEVQPVK